MLRTLARRYVEIYKRVRELKNKIEEIKTTVVVGVGANEN